MEDIEAKRIGFSMSFVSIEQASLGGRVRIIVTGAAPISAPVMTFFRAAMGCQVYEAYGQTECTAGCTFTSPGDWTSGKSSICWAGGAMVGRKALTELGLWSLDNLSSLD